MNTYAIRREAAWQTWAEVRAASRRSREAAAVCPGSIRWVRTYLIPESDGGFGSICIYEAVDGDTVRDHSRRVGIPVTEIHPVAISASIPNTGVQEPARA
jgi:hypothetical protein